MASISQCYASWRLDQVRQCAKLRVGLVALVLHALSLSAMAQSPRADSPEVRVARTEQGVMLSGSVRFDLSSSIEDALLKGVPVHFVYEADVVRERWYWLDRRVSARSRHLRLSHQLLTRKWRLATTSEAGGFAGTQANIQQTFDNLADALAAIKRINRWKIAELQELEGDSPYLVHFRFRLDLTQLPRPLQIGVAGQSEWSINQARSVPLIEERLP
jgi:hypothetical protein